ncbi:MAG TPA: bifunctional UDP-sugar hydrolase/5'-nucleotidase [Myxococcota bacterium]|nr:bifunctional UDP-sugar hydrolase/5'-nucleotidase [Myxococcota bacterium]HQK50305.1 bifunctional UDP-sugar hydrolase/5'-nucleotidase [Myxococcota bacterium]
MAPRNRWPGILAMLVTACAVACQVTTTQPDLEGQNVRVVLVHTTDIHSRLLPYPMKVAQTDKTLGLADENGPFGGIARIAHLSRTIRQRADRSLHIDTGDVFQGAPIFNVFQGEVEMLALSRIGVDVMTIGNHEFDAGEPNVADRIARFASFPVLAANYLISPPLSPTAPPLSDLVMPYHVFQLQGLRVAVIGLGNTSSMSSLVESPNSLGITPMDAAETTQFYIDLLRPHVDVIIIASHLGLSEDERLIPCISGADLVLGGHHHIVLNPPKEVLDGQSCHYEVVTRYFDAACVKGLSGIWREALLRRSSSADVTALCDDLLPEMARLVDRVPEVTGGVLPVRDRPVWRQACIEALSSVPAAPASIDALGTGTREDAIGAFAEDQVAGACFSLARKMGLRLPPPRKVPLAHSGAFAKYVGDFDAVFRQASPCDDGVDNDGDGRTDLEDPKCVDALDGSEATGGRQRTQDWEIASFRYQVLPVDARVPGDRVIEELLEPYVDVLKEAVPLDQVLGYAPTDAKRFGTVGGDSALGNAVAAAMQRRKGVETDFALTNSLGIRSDIYAGPVTVDVLYNVFPFENSITKMYLSGREVVELFDYVARRSSSRGCQAQAQVAGVRALLQCGRCDLSRRPAAWPVQRPDAEGCALDIRINGEALQLDSQYSVAVNDYIAKGGSGFMVLKRNTTQINTGVPQRDALMDFLRGGRPCGDLRACTRDGEGEGGCPSGYRCSCDGRLSWDGATCQELAECPGGGRCVLASCVNDLSAQFDQRCQDLSVDAVEGAECRCRQHQAVWLACGQTACIDGTNGIAEDGRLQLLPP